MGSFVFLISPSIIIKKSEGGSAKWNPCFLDICIVVSRAYINHKKIHILAKKMKVLI
jgi:hypothetical protein